MELRHLRYFVAVANELNVRQAAKRLHVSQPPLSRQIHDLEDELETKLFDRSKQKLALTPAGEAFLKEARQILAQVQRASLLAKAASRGEAGHLNIAILPPMGGLFLPPVIRAFRKRFPVVDLTILEMRPQEHITALLDRRIDLGFVPLPIIKLTPELEVERLREVELMAALPPGHRLVKQRQLTLTKLAHEPFVLFNPSSGVLLHDWILNLCREAGFEAQVVKLADGPASILEMVSAGFGVTLLPALFRRLPSDVEFRPLPTTTPKLHLTLAWRRDNESPLLKAFLEMLRARLR
jgi:LysR family transcriptional regulator, benzoate and cis,cis-muconate-responsive activator of ben and cat genes